MVSQDRAKEEMGCGFCRILIILLFALAGPAKSSPGSILLSALTESVVPPLNLVAQAQLREKKKNLNILLQAGGIIPPLPPPLHPCFHP